MTNKIFIDTNIFLRFFIPEDPLQHETCKKIIILIKEGKIIPYISTIVIHEFLFTMLKIYKQPKVDTLRAITTILALRNITVIEKTYLDKALILYKSLNIKFGDCLIATQIPKGVAICTYDPDFSKLPFLKVTAPDKIIKHG